MIITEILKNNADQFGEQTALIEREPAKNSRREISWAVFHCEANRVANFLLSLNVRKEDKVVLLMMNCLEWLPIYFGILRSGAWAVPLNFRFLAEDIRLCMEIAEAKIVIFGEEFIERIDQIRNEVHPMGLKYVFAGKTDRRPDWADAYEELAAGSSDVDPEIPLAQSDGAALYFTSGTTGRPKAVLLTHRNLESACDIENRHHRLTHADNFLCIPPLYHTGAKMHWFGNFRVGARSVLLKGVSPKWILEVISEEKITVVWLLVPWAHDILIALENGDVHLKDYALDQWRLMHIGAQPVPPALIKKWKKVFPHHDYDTNYGLTEATGPGCVHLGMENLHKVGAIGIPGHGWECAVVDADMKPVPVGQPGELVVKGPGVMRAYYKNAEASKRALINGWLLTGDIARMDEDGFIWLIDRRKDVIITGGENIFPVEIESFMMGHDDIQDIGVIGTPDDRLGEVVTAVIQLKPGKQMTFDDVMRFCESLPKYKRPRKVIFGDVPRNPTGKIEKPKLRRRYAGMTQSFKM